MLALVKNGTRTAELVQQRRRRVRSSGEKFFALTRRAFLRRQTTLCPIFSSMISVVYCVARCICCVVLFASHCNDIGSGGKCTEKSESSTIFIIILIVKTNFCHFHITTVFRSVQI